jgi:hypothetical protein
MTSNLSRSRLRAEDDLRR